MMNHTCKLSTHVLIASVDDCILQIFSDSYDLRKFYLYVKFRY